MDAGTVNTNLTAKDAARHYGRLKDMSEQQPITSDVPLGITDTLTTREKWKNYRKGLEEITPELYKYKPLLDELRQLSVRRDLHDFLLKELERTIKYDVPVKSVAWYTGTSTFTREPLNSAFKGGSSTGKTWNVTNTLGYFPTDICLMLSDATPKAFIRENGKRCIQVKDQDGNLIEKEISDQPPEKPTKYTYPVQDEFDAALRQWYLDLKQWKEDIKNSYVLLDMNYKIIVFLDSPRPETLSMLKTLMSHDKKRQTYKFVDKSANGPSKTQTVQIDGWPAICYLDCDSQAYMHEIATRCFSVTPSIEKEKFKAANNLTSLKNSCPWECKETQNSKMLKLLLQSILEQVQKHRLSVIIPAKDLDQFYPADMPRDMRDYTHFGQLIKAIAIFHLYQRPIITINKEKYVVAAISDIKLAFEIFQQIAETTRTNTDARALKFYHDIVENRKEGFIRVKEATLEYNKKADQPLSSDTINNWLNRLSEINYCSKEQDPEDRRGVIYKPILKQRQTFLGEEKAENHRKLENQQFPQLKIEAMTEKWFNELPKEREEILELLQIGSFVPVDYNITELPRFIKGELPQQEAELTEKPKDDSKILGNPIEQKAVLSNEKEPENNRFTGFRLSSVKSEIVEPKAKSESVMTYRYLPPNLSTPKFCARLIDDREPCGKMATVEASIDGIEYKPFCEDCFREGAEVAKESGFKFERAEAS